MYKHKPQSSGMDIGFRSKNTNVRYIFFFYSIFSSYKIRFRYKKNKTGVGQFAEKLLWLEEHITNKHTKEQESEKYVSQNNYNKNPKDKFYYIQAR